VVADSFFEWRREGTGKRPVRFLLKSEEPFAFAGIWHYNEIHNAFVIITTEPNDMVRPVHTRMPVILDRDDYTDWLSPDTSVERLVALLRPYPVGLMRAYDVNPIVGSAKVDSASCIEPYQQAQGNLF
jgi:putative SOS response-associated peptidase YedK